MNLRPTSHLLFPDDTDLCDTSQLMASAQLISIDSNTKIYFFGRNILVSALLELEHRVLWTWLNDLEHLD